MTGSPTDVPGWRAPDDILGLSLGEHLVLGRVKHVGNDVIDGRISTVILFDARLRDDGPVAELALCVPCSDPTVAFDLVANGRVEQDDATTLVGLDVGLRVKVKKWKVSPKLVNWTQVEQVISRYEARIGRLLR